MEMRSAIGKSRAVALFLVAMSGPGWAQDIAPQSFHYPYEVLVYDLPTAANGVNYRLYVRPPLRDPGAGERASSFYFLDAQRNFVPAAAMTSNYEYFNYIPAAYFIGIGYQDEADGVPKEHNRTRDYTPTKFVPPNQEHFLASNPVEYVGSGGADAFLNVIQEEIVPFIESKFPVDKNDRVLIGKSMSGLAATHAMLTKPGLFNRYVIISPSIWWDDWLKERSDRAIMRVAHDTADQDFPFETRAYFAVGDAEEQLGLVTDLYVLTNTLRNRRNERLKVYLDVLEDELHEGVFPGAFMRGIVGVYADEPNRRPSASAVTW
jgi:hypothetical protein